MVRYKFDWLIDPNFADLKTMPGRRDSLHETTDMGPWCSVLGRDAPIIGLCLIGASLVFGSVLFVLQY